MVGSNILQYEGDGVHHVQQYFGVDVESHRQIQSYTYHEYDRGGDTQLAPAAWDNSAAALGL
jgi:hypothetical protein